LIAITCFLGTVLGFNKTTHSCQGDSCSNDDTSNNSSTGGSRQSDSGEQSTGGSLDTTDDDDDGVFRLELTLDHANEIAAHLSSALAAQTALPQQPAPLLLAENPSANPLSWLTAPAYTVVLNGKPYAVLSELGRGGSATVYRVANARGEVFALKRMTPRSVHERKRFETEIEILQLFARNPRVVLLEDWQSGGSTFDCLMEAGEADLSHVLRVRQEAGSLSVLWVRSTWQQMLEAVCVVHKARIVHGDLKPANFLFVQGHLKLIDFGIAERLGDDDTVFRKMVAGTPNYMAPESLQPGAVGCASDVWALGCILYLMIYGRAPFALIGDAAKKNMGILSIDIDFPTHPHMDLDAVVDAKACLQRYASARPSSDQLVAVLEARQEASCAAAEGGHPLTRDTDQAQLAENAKEIAALRAKLLLAQSRATSAAPKTKFGKSGTKEDGGGTGSVTADPNVEETNSRREVLAASGIHRGVTYAKSRANDKNGNFYAAKVTRFPKAFKKVAVKAGLKLAVGYYSDPIAAAADYDAATNAFNKLVAAKYPPTSKDVKVLAEYTFYSRALSRES
jgi:hypothetical protein